MDWNRSSAIGLALASCTQCEGHGLREIRRGTEIPCSCVFRAIFRACYRRFRECASPGVYPGSVSLDHLEGPIGKRTYGLKREEYMADFCLAARRELSDNDYRIFKFTFLLGADWPAACERLNLDRGTYFHHVYRIQGILGRTFAELMPYPLYPVDEYFGGHVRKESMAELRRGLRTPRIRKMRDDRLPMTA